MGVSLMENFSMDVTASADIVALMAAKGWVLPTSSALAYSIQPETENGIAKPFLRQAYNYSSGLGTGYRWMALKIPIPASKSFYFSARIRFPHASIPTAGMRFYMGTAQNNTISNNFAYIEPGTAGSTRWNFHAGYAPTNPTYTFPTNTWVCVEIYRAPDGSVKLWLDDMLLTFAQTVTAPADNFIYFGQGSTDNVGAIYNWDYADIVVVDPATAGLQYRPGARHRVINAAFTADNITQWDLPSGASGTHYPIVAGFQATPAASNILTGDTVGEREQYSGASVVNPQPTFDKVLSVMLEQRVNNAGAATHVLSNEIDVGAGIVEVATQSLVSGAGWQYRPVFVDKKPDGSNWSLADVAALKAGYSIKS